MGRSIEDMEDRELMAMAYSVANQLNKLQQHQVAIQGEIEKRSIEFINSKKEKESTDGKAKSNE